MAAILPIETPRLTLREHTGADLIPLHALLSDPAVTWYLPDMARADIEGTEGYLRAVMTDQDQIARQRYNLAIAGKDGVCVGEVGMHLIDGTLDNGCWGVGYYLRPDLWNKGYATEALTAAIAFLFSRGARKVSAACLAENTPSRMVLWKCGFTREGTLKEHTWHDCQWKDCVVYRLLREEWEGADNTNTEE